jgi:site-specific DNA recombinase
LIKTALLQLAAGKSGRSVWQELVKAGLTGRDGGPICLLSLQQMIANPFYCGLLRYQGEVYEGKHEPLIAKDVFEVVQAGKATPFSMLRDPEFLLKR